MTAERDLHAQTALRAEDVVRLVNELTGRTCPLCRRPLCGHEVVASVLLGLKNDPRCLECMARDLGHESRVFVDQVRAQVRHRECFEAGWQHSDTLDHGAMPCRARSSATDESIITAIADDVSDATDHPADAAFDAGDMGCGDLVLELRIQLKSLRAGSVLHVTARDPGAPEDLPAWCRLTGHTMLAQGHPEYWIRRRPD